MDLYSGCQTLMHLPKRTSPLFDKDTVMQCFTVTETLKCINVSECRKYFKNNVSECCKYFN